MNFLVNTFGNTFVFWLGFILTALYGLCFGSFLNVLIYRIPKHESIMKSNSHCVVCGNKIKWYDNIPLLSYIILRGRCRNCNSRISLLYPVVEFLNAFLWELVYLKYQYSVETLIYFALVSVLLALSVIDEKTYEIPVCFNYFLLVLGIIYVIYDYRNFISHIVGMFCISIFLVIIWWATYGNGIGLGDVKLMFTCGFLLGWKLIIVGFLLGCIIAIPVHLLRMKLTKKENKLAFGPYLSLGIYISLFIGNNLMNMYLDLLF